MANNTYDQVVLNEREKPLSSDLNLQFSQADQTLRELLLALGEHCVIASTGTGTPGALMAGMQCIGEAFRVQPLGSGLVAVLTAGIGYVFTGTQETDIGAVGGLNDKSQYKPLVLLADTQIAIPAASGSPRVDIVEVKARQLLTDNSARRRLNADTGVFDPALLNKTLTRVVDGDFSVNGSGSVNYKTGTPAANPFPAATTAGYVKIAEVLIPASATQLGWEDISDYRGLFTPGGQAFVSLSWTQAGSLAAPSNVNVTMPPGFRYAIHNLSANQSDIYIIAPRGFTKGFCTAMSGMSDKLVTGNGTTTPAAVHTATAGDKSAVEGSNTFPAGTPRLLADGSNYTGQTVFKFSVLILTIDAGTGTLSYANATPTSVQANIVLS